MANLAGFEQLINQLMSDDNNVRGEAEKLYTNLKQTPDTLVIALLQIIRSALGDRLREMCVVLLRPLLVREPWETLSAQSKSTVSSELLIGLEQEKSVEIRHKLCSAISELACHAAPKGEWPALLPFMFKCTKSESEDHRESALIVFGDLARDMGDQFKPHFNVLKDILTAGLTDNSFKVRIAALQATANFLQVLPEPNERAVFQQLTPLMLETVNTALNAKKEEEAQSALELFIELAEAEPSFFRSSINQVVDNMIHISSAPNLEDSTRHLAIEVLLTLVDSRPGMMRKIPTFISRLLHVIVTMLLTIEDQPVEEWNSVVEEDETDITDYEVAEEALDRLAIELGGKALVPELFPSIIPSLLNNPDWRHRHGGLMAISLVGEGCSKFLVPHLSNVIGLVLPKFTDPHPRVRWAACNCAGQMAADFAPGFQKQFHSSVLPALALLMDDVNNPRVQSHAASALINFCEDCEVEILEPYLDGLLAKLALLLQGGKVIVQEQAITAIAAIADCTSEKFAKYYSNFIPYLKTVLVNANNKEYRKLRGKAMECISLIGVAVGKETFFNDAKEVMNIMVQTQAGKLEPDDPQITFMQQAWARICKCLGTDFVQFLPCVMPSLLASANAKTDLKIIDADEDVSGNEGWDFVTVGEKQVGINTTTLEEKSTACHMLYCYASELKEGFFPYVDAVANIIAPLLKFFYHDGVRTAAVSCVPALLVASSNYLKQSAGPGADPMYTRKLFNFMFPSLLEGIGQEMDLDILYTMVAALVEAMDIVGENVLDQSQMALAKDTVKTYLEDYAERMQEQAEKKKAPDVDDEEEDKLNEEVEKDEECLSQIADLIGRMAKYQKSAFLPHFEELFPVVVSLLQPDRKASERQVALCILDDVIEFTGKDASRYFESFLQAAISYITDEDPGVRQAAVYGIGVFAAVGAERFAPFVPDVLQRLNAVVSAPNAREPENINPTENAISAVGRICESQAGVVNLALVLPVWLSYLPVSEDKTEAIIIYNCLCSFVEKASVQLLGNNYEHLPKLFNVFGEALGSDMVNEELTKRIVVILKQMQSQLPREVLQNAWVSLSPQLQTKIQQASV